MSTFRVMISLTMTPLKVSPTRVALRLVSAPDLMNQPSTTIQIPSMKSPKIIVAKPPNIMRSEMTSLILVAILVARIRS